VAVEAIAQFLDVPVGHATPPNANSQFTPRDIHLTLTDAYLDAMYEGWHSWPCCLLPKWFYTPDEVKAWREKWEANRAV
jgi:hypothetical protein